MVIGKKFTVAGKKAIKAGIPKPGFNVYVDPDLRPVPQRSDYPDLNNIMTTKRPTEEVGFDTANIDAFALYSILVKHQGKSLNDIARILYGTLYTDANKENNLDSYYHTAAHVSNIRLRSMLKLNELPF
jgi:hypothetical protein